MKHSTEYPPNYRDILVALPAVSETKAIFTYRDTLYNPHGRKVRKDIEYHESIHERQQGDDPDAWWYAYLHDPEFRLAQEVEAYGEQFALVRPHIHGKLRQWALDDMAQALAGEAYGSLITFAQAQSRIRNYAADKINK